MIKIFTNYFFVSLFSVKKYFFVTLLSFGFFFKGVSQTPIDNPAVSWAELTLHILKDTPNGSPTFNSRFLGYCGLTMYESIVPSCKELSTLQSNLSSGLKLPIHKSKIKIEPNLSLNAGQAFILKSIYEFTSISNHELINSLEQSIFETYSKGLSEKEINASVNFGLSVANAIFDWSKSDGGHLAYCNNFDSTYQIPKGNGLWSPPAKGQSPIPLPLHPNWGKNRTFSKDNFALPIPAMVEYNYEVGSEYHNFILEVYNKRLNLTQSEKEIANWWGDDPSETFSPPGHSYNISTIAIKKTQASLAVSVKAYAAVGMAVADAFINCWKTKYHYNAERPYAFIYYNINTLWDLFWPEPPFPAFYSGHAAQAASAAMVLTDIFGDKFEFVDSSHEGRPRDEERLVEYKSRKFSSFLEAAEESAMSRLYGGIHTRHDNEVGLEEGKKIGENIKKLFY
jgi:hypothetical protein